MRLHGALASATRSIVEPFAPTKALHPLGKSFRRRRRVCRYSLLSRGVERQSLPGADKEVDGPSGSTRTAPTCGIWGRTSTR